jgi:hypothetical protein
MSCPKLSLSVDEIECIMSMYEFDSKKVRFYVKECLEHLEYEADYEYQFEDPSECLLEGEVDLYGQAVDRVAAFLKYGQPIIGGDEDDDDEDDDSVIEFPIIHSAAPGADDDNSWAAAAMSGEDEESDEADNGGYLYNHRFRMPPCPSLAAQEC